jgi:NAD(P)-dependent dehydrogenase (short-subunit alcohol dehydrogenase family)
MSEQLSGSHAGRDPGPASLFDMSGRVAIIAGGSGLLGPKHAEAIAAAGGVPVIVDVDIEGAERVAILQREQFGVEAWAARTDVTRCDEVELLLSRVLDRYGRVDVLINNAANNPKVEDAKSTGFSRLEQFPMAQWEADLAVGLTGAFLCSKVIGSHMASKGTGVIVNIASEYGLIAPDQRLYRVDGLSEDQQPVKPISYTVVKSGLLGMTRYLATYWADRGVRVNSITVGGVENGQDAEFLRRAAERIPLGRMARADEYQGAIVFLCSDASSFMTGANLVVDGGKSCW